MPTKWPAILRLATSAKETIKAKDEAFRPEEREFLPAALEILETPPSPAGRTVAFVVCAVAAVGIAWAAIGRVDIVAVASGKIVAQTRTKLVQPFETSTVQAILVKPGQKVRAGDALIELDPNRRPRGTRSRRARPPRRPTRSDTP